MNGGSKDRTKRTHCACKGKFVQKKVIDNVVAKLDSHKIYLIFRAYYRVIL